MTGGGTVARPPDPRRAERLTRPYPKSLNMQLMRARELMVQRFRPHLLEHGVTEQQWRVLRALRYEGAKTNLELTRCCLLNPASQSRILLNLDAMGLIRREADPQDRRRRMVHLTEAGRVLTEAIAPGNDRIFAAFVSEVTPEVVDAVGAVLDRLIDRLIEANAGLPELAPDD